jgi:hypothetical protein
MAAYKNLFQDLRCGPVSNRLQERADMPDMQDSAPARFLQVYFRIGADGVAPRIFQRRF